LRRGSEGRGEGAAGQAARYNAHMALFDSLGFRWDRDSVPRELPSASLNRVVFRFSRMLPEHVWDAGVLEGNPLTFPEVKTLVEGVTVGGRKLSDQEQILNLADSSRYLVELVKQGQFRLDKDTFCSLHARVARNEALGWGAESVNEVFGSGVRALQENVSNPFERATAFFLFGSLQQFFFDGNKRTSRFMMNGLLMTDGIDAISIPAVRATQFNSRMVDFYITRDATEMMAFVLDCHPEIAQIRQLNPGLSVIKDAPEIDYFRLNESMDTQTSGGQSTHARGTGRDTSLDSAEQQQLLGKRPSIKEMKRNAAENWRRNYYDKRAGIPEPESESVKTKENAPEAGKTGYERDAGIDFDPER
jgi:prophage maintenance system killer protein